MTDVSFRFATVDDVDTILDLIEQLVARWRMDHLPLEGAMLRALAESGEA